MNGWNGVDGWMGGWMEGWNDQWMYGRIAEWMDKAPKNLAKWFESKMSS